VAELAPGRCAPGAEPGAQRRAAGSSWVSGQVRQPALPALLGQLLGRLPAPGGQRALHPPVGPQAALPRTRTVAGEPEVLAARAQGHPRASLLTREVVWPEGGILSSLLENSSGTWLPRQAPVQDDDHCPVDVGLVVGRQPFAWTKDADAILASINRAKTKQASLQSTRLDIWPLTAYEAPVAGGAVSNDCGLASKRLRRRVLHQCSHLGTNTCGRMQFDRCCLVIRMQKMKPLAPNFNCYVERIDCPASPQHPHRGRDCQRARVAKVVIGERKNNGSELDAPGKIRRWEGYHSTQSPRRPATGLLVDDDGIRT
jgi:hypothetical protein